MAMRQRLGGVSSTRPRQSDRHVYEDFQPHFELKEEQDAHIILVQLPGFQKEQVTITFVPSPAVIRAHGQRLLSNSKWSRFNQTFPIQENSDTSKIHGKFNKGILTITVPKQAIKQIGGPKEAAKPIQDRFNPDLYGPPPTPSKTSSTTTAGPQKSSSYEPNAQKGQEGISQIATAAALDEKQKDKRSTAPIVGLPGAAAETKAQKSGEGIPLADTFTAKDQKERDAKNGGGYPLGPPKGGAETKAEKEKDQALPKVISAIQNEKQVEKRVVPLTSPERGTTEAKSQKGQDEIPPKRMDETKVESAVKDVGRKGKNEVSGKPAEAKNAEKVVETMLHKETDTSDISEETRVVPEISEQAKPKSKTFGTAVNRGKSKEKDFIAANVVSAAKQRMYNLGKRMNKEDKQMLINMGAAVLVLLALGASVSYSFWSSGKAKN